MIFGAWFSMTAAVLLPPSLSAAQPTRDPLALVKQAVKTEIAADDNDHSRWRYRDDQQELKTVSIVVQTDAGSVKPVDLAGWEAAEWGRVAG